jgi:hypothetical protein
VGLLAVSSLVPVLETGKGERAQFLILNDAANQNASYAGAAMAQLDPYPSYYDDLVDRVVEFLQTRDARIFPFTAAFDADQHAAFARDLREGLGGITVSGSARKSSATGYIASDRTLRRVLAEWSAADGGWPNGAFPEVPVTPLGSSTEADTPPPRAYVERVMRVLRRATRP